MHFIFLLIFCLDFISFANCSSKISQIDMHDPEVAHHLRLKVPFLRPGEKIIISQKPGDFHLDFTSYKDGCSFVSFPWIYYPEQIILSSKNLMIYGKERKSASDKQKIITLIDKGVQSTEKIKINIRKKFLSPDGSFYIEGKNQKEVQNLLKINDPHFLNLPIFTCDPQEYIDSYSNIYFINNSSRIFISKSSFISGFIKIEEDKIVPLSFDQEKEYIRRYKEWKNFEKIFVHLDHHNFQDLDIKNYEVFLKNLEYKTQFFHSPDYNNLYIIGYEQDPKYSFIVPIFITTVSSTQFHEPQSMDQKNSFFLKESIIEINPNALYILGRYPLCLFIMTTQGQFTKFPFPDFENVKMIKNSQENLCITGRNITSKIYHVFFIKNNIISPSCSLEVSNIFEQTIDWKGNLYALSRAKNNNKIFLITAKSENKEISLPLFLYWDDSYENIYKSLVDNRDHYYFFVKRKIYMEKQTEWGDMNYSHYLAYVKQNKVFEIPTPELYSIDNIELDPNDNLYITGESQAYQDCQATLIIRNQDSSDRQLIEHVKQIITIQGNFVSLTKIIRDIGQDFFTTSSQQNCNENPLLNRFCHHLQSLPWNLFKEEDGQVFHDFLISHQLEILQNKSSREALEKILDFLINSENEKNLFHPLRPFACGLAFIYTDPKNYFMASPSLYSQALDPGALSSLSLKSSLEFKDLKTEACKSLTEEQFQQKYQETERMMNLLDIIMETPGIEKLKKQYKSYHMSIQQAFKKFKEEKSIFS